MNGCDVHIEELLEMFLDEFEVMPVMNEIKDARVLCCECGKMARYELLQSDVKTTWE